VPEALVPFFAWVGSTVGGVAGAATIIYAAELSTITMALGLSAYGSAQRRKAERAARNAYNANLKDRNITVRGALEARQLVLGKVRTGGTIAFIGSTGTDKEKLSMVIALASNRCTAVDTIYFNDTAVTLDVNGYVQTAPWFQTKKQDFTQTMSIVAGSGSTTLTHTPIAGSVYAVWEIDGVDGHDNKATTTGTVSVVGLTASISGVTAGVNSVTLVYQYDNGTSHARVRSMLGSSTQTAFADLVTQFPSQWTANHRLRGVTYLVVELDYNQDAFPTGIPNVSAVVRGSDEIFDPRTSITGYSENPALLLRHYLLHSLGGRRTTAQIDDTSFIVAANVCDATVNYGGGGTLLYTAGIVTSTDAVPSQVVDELVESMAGSWGHSNGRIRIRAGSLATTAATITADWLAGGSVTIQARQSRQDLANVAQGTFVDGEHDWQVVQFPRVEDATAVSEDGASLVREMEFSAITRAGQAQQVAAVMLRYERQAMTVQLTCNMRAYTLQLLDVVAVTLDRFGWSGKLFEVVDRSYAHGGGISLTLKETGSSIFAFGTSFSSIDQQPNTTLPKPWSVPTVGTITVVSGTAALVDGSIVTRCAVSWPAVADRGVTEGGFIEVAYRDVAGANAEQIVRADTLTSHTIAGLRASYHYLFKARAVNGAGVRGNWNEATLHQIAAPNTSWVDNSNVGAVNMLWGSQNGPITVLNGSYGTTIASLKAGSTNPYGLKAGEVLTLSTEVWQNAASLAASQHATVYLYTATSGGVWKASAEISSSATSAGSRQSSSVTLPASDADMYLVEVGLWHQGNSPNTTGEVYADRIQVERGSSATQYAPGAAPGATVNATFVQASAPSALAVGDLWFDTDDGNKVYRATSTGTGGWVAYAFDTGAIAAAAATETYITNPSNYTVTAVKHTPDGFTWRNGVATYTFTPSGSGVATVYFDAFMDYTEGGTAFFGYAYWAIMDASSFDVTRNVDVRTAETSKTTSMPVSTSRRFAVTGGTAYTFGVYMCKSASGDTMIVKNMELRVEVIKR
jgi:hypothetical protein